MKTKSLFNLLMITVSLACNAQMRIHVINVGQGCATLVEFPCAAILIDTGGESNAYFDSSASLQSYLEEFFIQRPDLQNTFECVYLTHPHIDHTRGVSVIVQPPYKIKNIVTDGIENGSGGSQQKQLHKLAQDSEENSNPADNIGLEAVVTDEIGNTGFTNEKIDAVNCSRINPEITVLWGTSVTNTGWAAEEFKDANNHSLVIKIKYGESTFLVTGDLEEAALKDMIRKYNGSSVLDSDVYMVGHHGSINGTTQSLLDAVTPKIALIGAGDVGRKVYWTAWQYGHPRKEILQMLQQILTATRTPFHVQAGIKGTRNRTTENFEDYIIRKGIYCTAWDDTIVLETSGDKMWKLVDPTTTPMLLLQDTDAVLPILNLNTASVAQLEALPGIGSTKANAIFNYRQTHGNFTAVEQLDDVSGIGPATIDLVRPYVKI
ncbi:helix-hairpin-helix domain-containing protein [Flavobacterium silvaticum]|uniref:MBL fold metallo-hydrolase n=1 Tax=Flavobacterium silvaticum TaxID=1852020 RepID=A0A972FP95_9FLAO|nr:helix-hairpin-helix domain-containing protein [Flavobacterium silvaticum]NMH26914.1 MBL fold metallo-hydrolase [Flavobacterium silvaticum]